MIINTHVILVLGSLWKQLVATAIIITSIIIIARTITMVAATTEVATTGAVEIVFTITITMAAIIDSITATTAKGMSKTATPATFLNIVCLQNLNVLRLKSL